MSLSASTRPRTARPIDLPLALSTRRLSAALEAGAQGGRFPWEELRHRALLEGRYHLPVALLTALDRVREHTEDPVLRVLADCYLDLHEKRYDYRTYVAVPVLLALVDDAGLQSPQTLVAALVDDLLEFEERAPLPSCPLMSRERPSPDLARRRRTRLLRLREQIDARHLATESERVRHVIRAAMLPVSCSHDEYMFLRVLQCYEMLFATTALELVRALDGKTDVVAVTSSLDRAATRLDEHGGLFSLLATMQADSFRDFRQLTEGASAIQSEHYKLIEALCRRPAAARLEGPAFADVPLAAQRVGSSGLTVSQLMHNVERDHGSTSDSARRLRGAADRYDAATMRWKRTHVSLARRLLGEESSGSGYTAGTAYLRAQLDHNLFAQEES